MYQIQFLPQLNRVSWTFIIGATDANTGENLDLSIYDWKFEILEPGSDCARLTASTENGKLTTPELGILVFTFTDDEMRRLCPQTYPTRLTMTLIDSGDPEPPSAGLSTGPLPVIDR